MGEHIPLEQLMEYPRYRERGGMRILDETFRAEVAYELKIKNAAKTFYVSNGTAVKFYKQWRTLRGLR